MQNSQIRESTLTLAATVSAFIRNTIIPFERDLRQTPHGPAEDMVRELRGLARRAGLLAPHVGAAWGGHGLSHLETALVFGAAGYSPLGPLAMNIAAPDEGNMFLLEQAASEAQKRRFLAPLIAGEIRSAFLMTEPAEDGGAGSDPSMLSTAAHLEGGEWVISGRKMFITGAQGAGFGIIMAKTGEGATLFLADMSSPGIQIERVLDTIDSSMPGGHAVVRLEKVRVPQDQVLGAVNEGFRYAQIRLAPARLTHCMRWWGLAQRAQDIAVQYASKRQAFGKALIDHEGVGFMLADNVIELKQSELMIHWCAAVLDEHKRGTMESSMTKVAVSESLFRIADRCVQVMGGNGVTRDTVVEQAFREIRAFRIYDGPSEVHRWSIAKKLKRAAREAATN